MKVWTECVCVCVRERESMCGFTLNAQLSESAEWALRGFGHTVQ